MKLKNQKNLITQAQKIFKKYPAIKLVYFFGSQARGESGPLSDYDFAIYADLKDPVKLFNLKLEIFGQLGRILNDDKIDVVILNQVESPELKYHIIKDGKIIYEKEPFRVLVEPKILNEYFDFRLMMLRYGLTK